MREKFILVDGIIMDRKVSVIVRCRNEEQWIGHTLQSICDKFVEPEIIVVDNNSTDESLDIVRMFQKWNDVKEITIDDYSPGASLNLGFREASYEDVLVISSHCVLKDITDEHIELLDRYVAVFGKQVPIYRGRRINARYIWENFGNESESNMYSEVEGRYFLHNALCLYKRDFVLENPFDEKLYGKEDRYWARDVIEQNYSTHYDPSFWCEHHWTANGATWKGIG